MFDKILEKLNLVRCKDHWSTVFKDFHPGEIRCHVSKTNSADRCRLSSSSNRGLYSCHELARTKGFCDIVVRAQLQQQNFVGDLRNCAKNNNRSTRRPTFDALADLKA